jgi:hypothetical protein
VELLIGAFRRCRKLDLLDTKQGPPIRLITETILERTLRLFSSKENVNRRGITSPDRRVQAHAEP